MTAFTTTTYNITLEEIENKKEKYALTNANLYNLRLKNHILSLGDYSSLIDLHTRLKNVLQYDYIDNKDKVITLSYNERYFYIKNTKTNKTLGLQKNHVHKLSADIGRFLYKKMQERKEKFAKKD